MLTEDIYLRLINYASKAPSSHNSQPWKFQMEGDTILIFPDLSRSLPVVDPDNHGLFISLGCAVENLVIAARQYGLDSNVNSRLGQEEDPVQVKLTKLPASVPREPSRLFAHIKTRQVTRGPFDAAALDWDTVREIRELELEPGTRLKFILPGQESELLFPLVLEGIDRQYRNKAFKRELSEWFRFSAKEAMMKGDGVWGATMGFPSTGRTAGNFIMRFLLGPRSETRRWSSLFYSSQGYVLFMVAKHNPEYWIRLGRSFQRFGLAATSLGLKHAHMNMPVEEEHVREKIRQTFHLGEMTPLLLLRTGYADPAPYSFRRNLHEITLL